MGVAKVEELIVEKERRMRAGEGGAGGVVEAAGVCGDVNGSVAKPGRCCKIKVKEERTDESRDSTRQSIGLLSLQLSFRDVQNLDFEVLAAALHPSLGHVVDATRGGLLPRAAGVAVRRLVRKGSTSTGELPFARGVDERRTAFSDGNVGFLLSWDLEVEVLDALSTAGDVDPLACAANVGDKLRRMGDKMGQ